LSLYPGILESWSKTQKNGQTEQIPSSQENKTKHNIHRLAHDEGKMEITVQKATPNGYDRSQVAQKPAHRYNNRVHARRYDSPMIEQAESMGKTTLKKSQLTSQ